MDFTELICKLSLDYLAQSSQLTPTDDDFVGWVDSQPLPGRPLLYQLGAQKCWEFGNLSFQSWVLDARGFSFADYLVHRLTAKDYLHWIDLFGTTTLARYKNEYDNEDGDE